MKAKVKKVFDKLKKENISVRLSKNDHSSEDALFWIWCEGITDETTLALDYYDNYEGAKWLNELLAKNGMHFEWYNAASANVYFS